MIQHDINSVFMNENDFAEYHDLNGVRALAIVEALTIKDKLAIKSASFEGYYQKKVIVHVKQADLNEILTNLGQSLYSKHFRYYQHLVS